ncbi:MAG: MBL fold metallo-hydrolase [Promethearchaeia archaeon]
MILKKLVVGALGTNCYLFGSEKTSDLVIIDPGANQDRIKKQVEDLNAKPIAILLTHAHNDHTSAVKTIRDHYEIPLMYNRKEFDSGIYNVIKADRWLKEGDKIKAGEYTFHVLETPGHTPGSLSYYMTDVHQYKGESTDAIVFTGDLLFRRSIGRTDFEGGNKKQLFSSIRDKIVHNSIFSNDTILLPGHMGKTTLGFEKEYNFYRNYFL